MVSNIFPAFTTLTTGYVFPVENPATVYYLHRVGSPSAIWQPSQSPSPDQMVQVVSHVRPCWLHLQTEPI